jgi:hypothetical protein
MEGTCKIIDFSADSALARYAVSQGLRGKSLMEILRRIMKFWVSFHIAKVPKGDRAGITAYLTKEVTELHSATAASALTDASSKAARGRAAVIDALRNTKAARIMAAFNIYGARAAKTPEQFYALVKRWIRRREFSANLLRAGSLAALRALKVPRGGQIPSYNNAPGSYQETIADQAGSILVENWASQRVTRANPHPEGIVGKAGDSFSRAANEVEALVLKFELDAVEKAAAKEGFAVRRAA